MGCACGVPDGYHHFIKHNKPFDSIQFDILFGNHFCVCLQVNIQLYVIKCSSVQTKERGFVLQLPTYKFARNFVAIQC